MTMYKIDWTKYLTEDRSRQSVFKEDHPENKPVDYRNPFDSDFGRVLFTSAIRRMHDKTQVIPLTSGDSVHTRLTHSMEVMNIATSLGNDLCRKPEFTSTFENSIELERCIPKILATAGLCHDVGNPPFGHFGETIIQNYFKNFFEEVKKGNHYISNLELTEDQKLDFTEFDGNAQGFRVITKLQYIGDLAGLNLTYATLGAYLKYPNDGNAKKDNYIGNKKHGIYFPEKEIFNNICAKSSLIDRNDDGKIKRHPLSFLTEAADSICYLTMDIEDGYTMGWFSFEQVVSYLNEKIKKLSGKELNIYNLIKFKDYVEEKDHNGNVIHKYKKNDKRCMVDFRVKMIQYLVNLSVNNFIYHLEEIDNGSYSKELLNDDDNCVADALGKFAIENIFNQKEIVESELTGNSVLTGLLDILIKYVFDVKVDKQSEKIEEGAYYSRVKTILSKTSMKVVDHEQHYKNEFHHSYIDKKLSRIEGLDETFESFFYDIKIYELSDYSKLRMIVDFVSGMTDKYAVTLYQQLSGQRL